MLEQKSKRFIVVLILLVSIQLKKDIKAFSRFRGVRNESIS